MPKLPKKPLSKSQAIEKSLTGDWKNAIVINKNLLKENPEDVDALNRLAFAYTILGKAKEAKRAYRKVLKIDAVNPIALRSLRRLSEYAATRVSKTLTFVGVASFLEENGKTKIIELVNVAQARVIARLRAGQPLNISIKRLKVFLLEDGRQYIGVLPDDVGKRLIKFIKAGGSYEVYVKVADEQKVVVFIKEIRKPPRFKDQPSFVQANERLLGLEKKTLKIKSNYKDEEGKDYEEEADGSL